MWSLISQSCICLLLLNVIHSATVTEDYEKTRQNLIREESMESLGGRLNLNEAETKVNRLLMYLKDTEYEKSFYNPRNFNLSKHYFSYKDQIAKSEVYKIIRQMPKAGALHIHSTLMLDADDLLKLTYDEDLYACYTNDKLKLSFSRKVPLYRCSVKWTLMSELRNASKDIASFDAGIKNHYTLMTDDWETIESDINAVWRRFSKVYFNVRDLIAYRPAREKFFYAALKKFYDDNVMYVEIRSGLHTLYELDGQKHPPIYMAKLYKDITNKFIKEHPGFIGIKLIATGNRASSLQQVEKNLNMARQLKKEHPDLFAGFDLVGQEDLGKPLKYFLPVLSRVKDEMNFYFHGGETNWFGTTSDENLFDAILLGTKRIGHAYALAKHPTLLSIVKEKDIALEVNVISNVVLCLVNDVRNHPLANYLARGLPVVLSSDDPGMWGAEPLSHDFYVSFVAIASKHADLRVLKQLALNSIKYSALDNEGKSRMFDVFHRKWCTFLSNIISQYMLH